VLSPIWHRAPETASRLRGRIETVWAAAQVAGHIPPDRPNPARWKNWLQMMLPNPKRLGDRGHHAALDWRDMPSLMARLRAESGAAAKALQFVILTVSRTTEALNLTADELEDLDGPKPTWIVPSARMKMKVEHRVPLSPAAVAIVKEQLAKRGKNPHLFASPLPKKALSNMAMSMLLRRLGIDATVHGFRSTARSWMADHGVAFDVAEACLAHAVGNAVVRAYQRSSLLELRRPVLESWAKFLSGESEGRVIPLKKRG
jgi:integrase